MNSTRRKQILQLRQRMESLKAEAQEVAEALSAVREEEQAYFVAMPDGIQGSERGQAAETAIEALDTVIDQLTDFSDLDLEEEFTQATA